MKRNAQVIALSKDWWKKERPAAEGQLVVKRRTKIPTSPLMTVKEVAGLLSVKVGTIYDRINDGKLECQRVGRCKRISREALEDFLNVQNLTYGRG